MRCTTSAHLGPFRACVTCSCASLYCGVVSRPALSLRIVCVWLCRPTPFFEEPQTGQCNVLQRVVQTSLAHPLPRLMDDERRRPPPHTERAVDAPRLRVLGWIQVGRASSTRGACLGAPRLRVFGWLQFGRASSARGTWLGAVDANAGRPEGVCRADAADKQSHSITNQEGHKDTRTAGHRT